MSRSAAKAATSWIGSCEEVVFATTEPGRTARYEPLPDDLAPRVRDVLEQAGIDQLFAFQRHAIDAIRDGRHTCLTGGTGSGKSLCYQLPALEEIAASGRARVLYLAPTKALAQDQARRLAAFGMRGLTVGLYDGDTPRAQRAAIRRTAKVVLTNPDMLSAGILPSHIDWAQYFAHLTHVVIDEAHVYRGVFGSHVANVIRRLRRVCASYGAYPVFIASSGTIANPDEHFTRLVGLEATIVGDAGARQGTRDILLWNPELDEDSGERTSPIGDASRVFASLIEDGVSTIVFARTRRSCELIYKVARERLDSRSLEHLSRRIAPYRAGYTPEQRRETERGLASGELVGVVATNALELGIDIGSLDAAVCVTFPGSVTSLRQQWGRAGRAGSGAMAVLIGGHDALDQYFMQRPQTLIDRPIERAVLDNGNLRILAGHAAAAACELPLGEADRELFGAALDGAVELLEGEGRVRRTKAGIVYCATDHPAGDLSLRSASQHQVLVVDGNDGTVIGTVDTARAARTIHPGAVYLHRGESFLVQDLDLETGTAVVQPYVADYYTVPKLSSQIDITGVLDQRIVAGVQLVFGTIRMTEELVAYQRKSITTQAVIDTVPQSIPPQTLETEAIWFSPDGGTLDGFDQEQLLGALHAAEHGMIALLPLLAMCDRNDIGGLSTDWHPHTGKPTIFVYDGHDGGVGITETGFYRFEHWVQASHTAIVGCPCKDGCPSCVQSPKCGNLNEHLYKQGAQQVLDALLDD